MKTLDLTGVRFGRLTVLYRVGSNKQGIPIWHCKCDCGNEIDAYRGNLRRGHTNSCGCYKKDRIVETSRQDLTGKRFGKLVVIEYVRTDGKRAVWKCKCDCGAEKDIFSTDLTTRKCVSCGCYRKSIKRTHGLCKTKEYNRLKACRRRERCNILDYEWTNDKEVELSRFFSSCVICGSTNNLETDHVYPLSLGYSLSPGNAVKLCKSCNSSKGDRLPDNLPRKLGANAREKLLSAAGAFRNHWAMLDFSRRTLDENLPNI